jgi:predicted RNA-binding protein
VKFWLLKLTQNQVLRLAILKMILSSKQQQQQQKLNHRLRQVADYQPGDHLKEGIQIFIILSVQQKV